MGLGIEIWEERVGARKASCSGTVSGPAAGDAGGEFVLVGDWSAGDRLGRGLQKRGALVCVIWIGIGGGLGEVDWGAGGEKLRCERELGRGEHGLLGICSLGILMLGGQKGGPRRHRGHMGRTGLWMVVAVVSEGDTHLVEVALVTQTSLVFGAEF